MAYRLLFVDDEADVLLSYERNFRKNYSLTTALSGEEALKIMKESQPFAMIFSDFKMGALNGVEFLAAAKEISPSSVRVLITGYADLQTSIKAVNEGSIYRFLTKPISIQELQVVIDEGINQYKLANLEKELLNKTLKGTIKVLVDILTIVQPQAFQQAKIGVKLASKTAELMNVKNLWEIEIAALLSPIGSIGVPQEILEKKNSGKKLTESETNLYASIPQIGYNLIKSIPYLERISKIILNLSEASLRAPASPNEDETLSIARIIRAAIDYEMQINAGQEPVNALKILQYRKDYYGEKTLTMIEKALIEIRTKDILEAKENRVQKALSQTPQSQETRKIMLLPLELLGPGMILVEPIKDSSGNVILNKGYEMNDMIIERLINISIIKKIEEPIKVYTKQ